MAPYFLIMAYNCQGENYKLPVKTRIQKRVIFVGWWAHLLVCCSQQLGFIDFHVILARKVDKSTYQSEIKYSSHSYHRREILLIDIEKSFFILDSRQLLFVCCMKVMIKINTFQQFFCDLGQVIPLLNSSKSFQFINIKTQLFIVQCPNRKTQQS